MTKHIFVYGTLMSSFGMNRLFEGTANKVGKDTIRGSMFDIGSFPGIKLDDAGTVQGELYEITEPSVLGRLDAYEGEGSLYMRRVVETEGGVETYVYEFNHDVDRYSRIEDGDYLNHKTSRRG